jgi:hypothetical protein
VSQTPRTLSRGVRPSRSSAPVGSGRPGVEPRGFSQARRAASDERAGVVPARYTQSFAEVYAAGGRPERRRCHPHYLARGRLQVLRQHFVDAPPAESERPKRSKSLRVTAARPPCTTWTRTGRPERALCLSMPEALTAHPAAGRKHIHFDMSGYDLGRSGSTRSAHHPGPAIVLVEGGVSRHRGISAFQGPPGRPSGQAPGPGLRTEPGAAAPRSNQPRALVMTLTCAAFDCPRFAR